jgi:hypothetical protein
VFRIPDPTTAIKEEREKYCCPTLFFLPKKLSLSSQKYGFGMESGIRKNLFQIPDLRVKKAPDLRFRSVTLIEINPVGYFPMAGHVGRYGTVRYLGIVQ